MAKRATLVVVVVVAALLAPLSPATTAPTPDERLVAELRSATQGSQSALRNLAQPTDRRKERASADLVRALASIDAARTIAPRAVGALETRSVRVALRQGRALARVAATDVTRGRYAQARTKLRQAIALKTQALRDFGRPLRREFAAKAVNRSFARVPLYKDYSGVTASASEEVVEIVIGRATRATANASETYVGDTTTSGLEITSLTAYQIQDPIGAYTTNWCTFDGGLITCPLRPTLTRDHLFTLAFTPKLARGTEVLVIFRAASGRSSYSVYTVR